MPSQTYEGYFENGRFYSEGKIIDIPERRRAILILLDEQSEQQATQGGGMTNGAAIGYAMITLANLDYSQEDIKKVEKEMYRVMDEKTEEEAERYYQNN